MSHPVPLDAFVAPEGTVRLGPAQLGKDGCWHFFVNANPPFVHSAQYVAGFDTAVEDGVVLVTARMTSVPRSGNAHPVRVALVCDIENGVYPVFYRDPDGKKHDLGRIEIDLAAEIGPQMDE